MKYAILGGLIQKIMHIVKLKLYVEAVRVRTIIEFRYTYRHGGRLMIIEVLKY